MVPEMGASRLSSRDATAPDGAPISSVAIVKNGRHSCSSGAQLTAEESRRWRFSAYPLTLGW
jgi:hypothetical protein